MANILDRYGIKEVCDFTLYNIEDDGSQGAPALFLDTLKISTVEQTADNTSARGGKGNAELIIWDFGREITLNLQDALFSAKSMAIMYGCPTDKLSSEAGKVYRTWMLDPNAEAAPTELELGLGKTHTPGPNAKYYKANGEYADKTGDTQEPAASGKFTKGAAFVTDEITTKDQTVIVINAETFPGTYYCVGDTYSRSEVTGKDSFFQIQIPKAKMLSDITLTLEAEGDPTVFDMQMKVLRPKDGDMMKLVKYDIA
jgi:hypothetical protein